jgi:hypothetical protein
MMWWVSCSATAYLFLGVQLAAKFGTENALAGMVIAAIVIGPLGGILASYSLSTGASSSVLSRTMFGTRGGLACVDSSQRGNRSRETLRGSELAWAFALGYGRINRGCIGRLPPIRYAGPPFSVAGIGRSLSRLALPNGGRWSEDR